MFVFFQDLISGRDYDSRIDIFVCHRVFLITASHLNIMISRFTEHLKYDT